MALPVAHYFSGYTPEDVRHLQRLPLFLQGSTDWGAAAVFAATMALYVIFGLLASFFLTFRLDGIRAAGFRDRLGFAARALSSHGAMFLVGGLVSLPYDLGVTANDFRNMFLLAALVYAASVLWVCFLRGTGLSLVRRLCLAPLFTVLWLAVGSDGTTAKAGQNVGAYLDPAPTVRGHRHAIMLRWHALCDTLL